ncbi:pirin family protein [Microlunatus soli]|uniref:Pirin n=1 Tax=Microlunatus soli TaxID=630515 RepID=A0A1H1RWM0_9ACTN|nr:pirin family protein [Microlunatus soli]SDS40053.1 hypothetical protein SAMN04489812_1795 [Microlunatus soli]
MKPLLIAEREVPLGGVRGITVHRTLPSRELPTIGAWCFLDRFGPAPADSMVVLPHPHTALQTVTWPISGSIHHRDSVGSDVIVRPGELNLMTAGHGVSHSEISLAGPDPLRGLQFWVALPDSALQTAATFEQHTALPTVELANGTATVLAGRFAGTESPASTFTPLVGAQLALRPGISGIELDPSFEHGLMIIDGRIRIEDTELAPGPLHYFGVGSSAIELRAESTATVIIIGGRPFDSELIMWWNFIGRSHEDIVTARQQWQDHDGRFGSVAGSYRAFPGADGADRIPAPPMPSTRLKPRRRHRPSPTAQ